MPYLKLEKDVPVTATITEYKGPKEGNYGKQYVYDLDVAGEHLDFYATELVHDKLSYYKLGDAVVLHKVFTNGKNFINVSPADPEKTPPRTVAPKPVVKPSQGQPDDIQKRITMGMSLNCASRVIASDDQAWNIGEKLMAEKMVRLAVNIYQEYKKIDLNTL